MKINIWNKSRLKTSMHTLLSWRECFNIEMSRRSTKYGPLIVLRNRVRRSLKGRTRNKAHTGSNWPISDTGTLKDRIGKSGDDEEFGGNSQ